MIVYSTVPSAEVGRTIAEAVVREGLCVCVNRIPGVTSCYIYEESFCEEVEELLILKTLPSHFERLEARITELHPYEVPEIIGCTIDRGNAPYMEWIAQSLK
jgi:periplasmic divalent cation tolerance protein